MRRNIIATTIALVAVAGVVVFIAERDGNDCGAAATPTTDNPDVRFQLADEGFTVRIESAEDFHVGALDWFLRIGDVQFYRYQYPDSFINVIEFEIPESALELLNDGDSVSVHYGSSHSAPFKTEPEPPELPGDTIATYIAASCTP